jgi:WD40 repeat protein
MSTLDQIQPIDDYFAAFGRHHVQKASQLLQPLHVPGQDVLPDFSDMLRQPFEPQAHVIAAGTKMLDEAQRGIIAAECGTGKTMMGMLTIHKHAQRSVRKGGCNGRYRAIVLCPDHLIKKWRDELEDTIPSSPGSTLAQQFDWRTGRGIGPLLAFSGIGRAAAYSSSGAMIAIGSASTNDTGGEVRLWDAATGTAVGSPIRCQGAVRAIAFSPDDGIILSGGEDQSARFWDVANGKPIGPPLLHERAVVAVAFSPDGRIAATACEDQTARLWHVLSGVPLGLPLRHEREVRTLAFSPEGTTLLTGGADRMIHF